MAKTAANNYGTFTPQQIANASDLEALRKSTPVYTPPAGAPAPAPVTSVPAPAPVVAQDPTPASLGLTYTPDETELAIEKAQKAQTFGYDAGIPDEGSIRQKTLQSFQAEIDALNKAAAEERARVTSQYKDIGNRRVGSQRALLANSGMIGQVSGESEKNRLVDANTQELNAAVEVSDEKYESQKRALLGQARTLAAAEYERKLAAYSEGAKSAVEYLKSRQESKKSAALNLAKSALLKGINLTDPKNSKAVSELAKQIGVLPDVLISAYGEAIAADKKAKADLAKENRLTLSEGQVQYELQPDGSYKQVAAALPKDNRTSSQKDYEFARSQGFTGSFTDFNSSSSDGLTPYQKFQATQSIAKDNQARTESAREMARQAQLIDDGYKNIQAGGDRSLNTQQIITAFNKILDPTSVVRESEYDRTAQGQSLIAQLQGKIQNISSGGAGVTEATLKEASDIAKKYLEGAKQSINIQNQRAMEMANQFGLNPDFVTSSYNTQPATLEEYIKANPADLGKATQILNENPNLTDQDVLQILNPGFKNGGSDPSNALGFVGPVKPASVVLGSRLAKVNNNPGNLRFVGQAGAQQGDGGFAKFATPEAGVIALANQIKLDASRGHTLQSFINKYAPPVENNTSLYVTQIAQRLGVDPSVKISQLSLKDLTREIAKKESSTIIQFA